jgi:hypothetical protein
MDEDKTPMQRFEDLARKLFSIAKKDVEKAEEVLEDAIEPTEKPEADE